MAGPTKQHTLPEITAHLRALHSQMQQQQIHNAPISPAQLSELMDMIEELEDLPEQLPDPPEK
jgi:NifB/MoaA-like Fe-S oxidoreductase